MENCVYHRILTLPSQLSSSSSSSSHKPHFRFFTRPLSCASSSLYLRRRPIRVKASAEASHCEFSSLNSPLEPRSLVGKFLGGVLQNHPQLFHVAVGEELKLLADDRDAAHARMVIGSASDEALLHRRIAQLKENQCQVAVEDVMYLLIFYKFSEIRVPLVPKLSSCLYNGRLEILPSKDWELESIYTLEVLDMIREHITTVTGLRANSGVTESWATTKVRHFLLAQVYVASILYGYFLKSVALRYHLERNLSVADHDLHLGHRTNLSFNDMCPYGLKDAMFCDSSNMQSIGQGLIRKEEEIEDLKCYVMSFHPGSLQRCARLRSKEAVNLVGSYSCALFNNDESGSVENDDVILTSFSSLKRLVLEAVAFGSFLWETEDYIDNLYKLKGD
ncbi:UV-B-induced protein At3g17800, chloroplastic-like [Gastrolobium bilobum]|uniref:UV-B-induced protein At3g17800, chloroplastic-like n=1 Tax=Gastrolobium bilobum TaxID=150636 RepID=UPI002AB16E7C|nr:UV-B-induced protein At3g17800, chloroplastic-like [Gastrolobium bilobum]